jgi:hypothetical protein
MNDELQYPTDTHETYDTRIRLVPYQSESDSDKENVRPERSEDDACAELLSDRDESLHQRDNGQTPSHKESTTSDNEQVEDDNHHKESTPMRPPTPFTGNDPSIDSIQRNLQSRSPLHELYVDPTPRGHTVFQRVRTSDEIADRIIFLSGFAGLDLSQTERHRLTRLWNLLRDGRIIVAIANRARAVFNGQCAEIIEIYANIRTLEWTSPVFAGSNVEQFAFDLMRRLLAADVERFYEDAIEDVRQDNYGVIPEHNNEMNLILFNHSHPSTMITPNKGHVMEMIDIANDKATELEQLANKLTDESRRLKRLTNWVKNSYPNGTKAIKLPPRVTYMVEYATKEVDQLEMPSNARYRHGQYRCIHCKGKHASEDHHLSLGIRLVSDTGTTRLPTNQEKTNDKPNEDNSINEFKTDRETLSSQSVTHIQWQPTTSTLPLPSNPNLQRKETVDSPLYTRKSPTIFTTSRMYDSTPSTRRPSSSHHQTRRKAGPSNEQSRPSSDASNSSRNSLRWRDSTTRRHSRPSERRTTMDGDTDGLRTTERSAKRRRDSDFDFDEHELYYDHGEEAEHNLNT